MILPAPEYDRLSAEYVAFLRTPDNDPNAKFVPTGEFYNRSLIDSREWHGSPVMIAYAKYVALRCLTHTFTACRLLPESLQDPEGPKKQALSYKHHMGVRYAGVTYDGNRHPIYTYEVYIYEKGTQGWQSGHNAVAILLVNKLGSGVVWESEWYSWDEEKLGPNMVTQKIYGGVGGSRLDSSDVDPKEFLTPGGYEYYQSKLMNHDGEDQIGKNVIESMESTAEDHGFIVEQIRIVDPVTQRIYERKYRPIGLTKLTTASSKE